MKQEVIYYCEQGNPYCIAPNCLCNTIRPNYKETKPMNTKDTISMITHDLKEQCDLHGIEVEDIRDGYHSFNELYEFRKLYNAALFNEWAKDYNIFVNSYKDVPQDRLHPEIKRCLRLASAKYNVHKSWKHHDGELCFGGGWFIVVAVLPTGQISNHYKAEDWDLFKIPETERALYEFDRHTPQDVVQRLKDLLKN